MTHLGQIVRKAISKFPQKLFDLLALALIELGVDIDFFQLFLLEEVSIVLRMNHIKPINTQIRLEPNRFNSVWF